MAFLISLNVADAIETVYALTGKVVQEANPLFQNVTEVTLYKSVVMLAWIYVVTRYGAEPWAGRVLYLLISFYVFVNVSNMAVLASRLG